MHFGKWLCLAALAAAAIGSADCGRADDAAPPPAPGLAAVQTNVPLTMNALLGSVNGEPVFVDDVLQPKDADLRNAATLPKATMADFRGMAREIITAELNRHIGEILMLKAARDAMTDEDQKRLEAYMNITSKQLISENGGSQAQADRMLRAKGSSLEKELEKRKRQFIIDLHLQRTLWPKIVITRAMLLEQYDRKIDQYTVPAEVNLYTITIPIAKFLTEDDPVNAGKLRPIKNPGPAQITEATNRAVAEARDLIAQLKSGKADFADLAHRYSEDSRKEQGGHWVQRVHPGMLKWTEVEKAAFALRPNSIADPVIVPGERSPADALVVIVRVDESTPGRVIPFAEAQKQIEQDLWTKQRVLQTNAYYTRLRAKAAMDEAIDRMVEIATDAAVARYAVK